MQVLLKKVLSKLAKIEAYMEKKTAHKEKAEGDDGLANAYLSTKDCYGYALLLLDDIFSKDELSSSLMLKASRSSKPGLDEKRVQQLIGLVEKRYPGKLDMKILISKVNQKCRDSAVVKVKREKQQSSYIPNEICTSQIVEKSESCSPSVPSLTAKIRSSDDSESDLDSTDGE